MSRCRVCQSEKVRTIFSIHGYEYLRCCFCHLTWTDPIPSNSDIIRYYTTQYANGNYKVAFDYESERKAVYGRYLSRLIKFTGTRLEGSRVLDIGCFTGVSLEILRDLGCTPYGVEFQKEAARIAESRNAGEVFGCDVNDLPQTKPFDVVTATDVIEHLSDPWASLSSIWRVMKPGGLLLITTPNGSSKLATLLGKNWPSYTPIHHIYIFSSRNVSLFLNTGRFRMLYLSPLLKTYSVGYIKSILPAFNPRIGRIVKGIVDFFPSRFQDIRLPFYGGEMFVIAERLVA